MARRTLADLYKRGKEVEFTSDIEGDGVKVWLRKPSPKESDLISRRANAARAVYLKRANDDESEEYLALYGQLADFGEELLIAIATRDEQRKAQARAVSQVAHLEEWLTDGYLESLMDRYRGNEDEPGLHEAYMAGEEDPNYEEARTVHDELQRYDKQVEDVFQADLENIKRDALDRGTDYLLGKATESWMRTQGDEAYTSEYYRQLFFLCTRETFDHAKKHFKSLEEVDELDEAIYERLQLEFGNLIVPVTEGKDSAVTPDSSSSSEQLDSVGEPQDSGPEDVDQ